MPLQRRKFLRLASAAAIVPATTRIVHAQDYPTRPVRIIEGFGGGSTPDLVARLVGQWLSERLGQPFVVESRTGAGGNIATQVVVSSAPDGYTLLTVVSANAINATLYEKLDFDFIRDIMPVGHKLFRVRCLRQSQSRQDQYCLARCRYADACGRGAIEASGRHRSR
jgi:tripartite-type tricarboxylate transporter receptor subunit TctC